MGGPLHDEEEAHDAVPQPEVSAGQVSHVPQAAESDLPPIPTNAAKTIPTPTSQRRSDYLAFRPGTRLADTYRLLSKQPVSNQRFQADDVLTDCGPAGICEALGTGGTGAVFLAEQELDEGVTIPRAIKFFVYRDDIAALHPESGPATVAHFRSELLSLASLNHEHILKIIDARFHEVAGLSIPFLVTEYVEGPTLQSVIESGELEACLHARPEIVMDIILQICRGVQYLHGRGFVHCDIAPKNIFLQGSAPDYRALIGDLGLGRSLQAIADDDEIFVAGTRQYCPRPVTQELNTVVNGKMFLTFHPEWDLYALASTILAVVSSLDRNAARSRPWHEALLQLERDVRHGRFRSSRFPTVAALARYVEWLHPIQHSLSRLQELVDNYPGADIRLIPLEQVSISPRLRTIFEHPAVQRLKRVPQLLLASAVFPSATHTRYEHALGTYQATRRYLRALLNDEQFLADCDPGTVELALVAAALSSVARFPLSIAIHEIKGSNAGMFVRFARADLLGELLAWPGEDKDDPTLQELVSLHFPNLSIEKLVGVLTDDPGVFIESGAAFVHFLLNSSIDARVIDFLRRDALHLGVSASNAFDFDELLRHIRFSNGKLAIQQQGVAIVEHIVALRYWMFGRIYWNRPNRCLLAMLKHVLTTLHHDDPAFVDRLRDGVLRMSEPAILDLLLESSRGNPGLSEVCEYLTKDRPEKFREILSVSRVNNTALCDGLVRLAPNKMLEVQGLLDMHLTDNYEMRQDRVHVLVDMPIETRNKKLGEDITVVDFDGGEPVGLKAVSGIVEGVNVGFDRTLQRARVFINPRTWDELGDRRPQVGSEMLEILNRVR